ncbi:MAG TPA: class I SAM-dependent methyltransferase [Bdellovibrionota bacterium]|nr:class I SAM-dependent methyltransferase [Bdellovibrionota bacterium]
MPKVGRKRPASRPRPRTPERDYLHGYSREEQDRLYRQARFLEQEVYEHVDFSRQRHVLEVGCGVGAQTEILLRRFPELHVQGVDASPSQLGRARQHLAKAIRDGRVDLAQADAARLPFPGNTFDGAFLCWFLEHVQNPVAILREIRRVLKAGSTIYCSELLNSTYFVDPYSPATLQYLFALNDHQWALKGDPFVGAKLGNYLLTAGFRNIHTEVKVQFFDNRVPKRRADYIDEWKTVLLSGAPALLDAGKVTREIVEGMKQELSKLEDDPDAVFFSCWVQARAEVV